MTRKVYPNNMVAHVWAQQDQHEGRSNNGNLSFEGDTLYSYRTPIARIIRSADDCQSIALITSESFSITTSGKHMPAARGAIPHDMTRFFVPTLADAGRTGRGAGTLNHKVNMAHFVAEFARYIATAKRARYLSPHDLAVLEEIASNAQDYATVFRTADPELVAHKAFEEIEAHRAKCDTPARNKAREAAAVRRAAKAAREAELERADYDTRMAAWVAGESDTIPRPSQWNTTPTVHMRVKGGNLQTSMGASVPLDHAIKVFRFVKLMRTRYLDGPAVTKYGADGAVWARNGSGLRVGHFQVDRVYADGSFVAGCHTIRWPAIESAAKAAGVADVEAADTTEATNG